MSGGPPWQGAPPKPDSPVRTLDPEAYALGRVLGTLIGIGSATAPRTQQRLIGWSELGYACDRRIAYKLADTPAVNRRDPLVTLIGTGVHAGLAESFARVNRVTGGRFLIEVPTVYRDVPGTCDLYDTESHTVVDWKTSTLDKISHLKSQGPALNYMVQPQGYAAGLTEQGHEVHSIALVFIPRDGKSLDQLWVWRTPFNREVADGAVDRMAQLQGKAPATVAASPDRLCGWCAHYLPGSTDLTVGCPGMST